ncbi:hypothetical protein [Candidatus Burkholderia verschuerenii]|uniref:hypothetical protein n=1 Tax=Candidatus Burkholderia verschuerenii TaxID=242163 RepID=UPI0012EEDA32|nr:hypothetical protein [Candidatus Burkholderia verschuerenii]
MTKALALVASVIQRGGIMPAADFGHLLGVLAVTAAETDTAEGDILWAWAWIIMDSADATPG